MSDVVDVVVENGVLSFDGRVVESFGCGLPGSQRVHIADVEVVKLTRKKLVGTLLEVDGRGNRGCTLSLELEESQASELDDFIDRVRAAAPNLKE